MAYAGPPGSPRRLFGEIPHNDTHSGSAISAVWRLEGCGLFWSDSSRHCSLCPVFRSVRSYRPTRPAGHPDGPAPGFLLPVALRPFIVAPAVARDSGPADRTCDRVNRLAGAPVLFRRGREELEAAPNRGTDDSLDCCGARHVYQYGEPCAVESSHGRLDWRSDPREIRERTHAASDPGSAGLPVEAVPQLPRARRNRREART